MEIQKYFQQKKELYDILFKFIEYENDSTDIFEVLIDTIESQNINENKDEFVEFIILLSKIAKNHHRFPMFINRIEQILIQIDIKQTLSNIEIFNLFKNNKRILLFLFQEKILIPDETILKFIDNNQDYTFYFYNEIKPFLSQAKMNQIEKDIQNFEDVFNNFEEKCQNGENDSFICSLIRNDSIDQFVVYSNQTNMPLSSKIKPSFFETNNFLLKKKDTTLIEYAAFFGSIQIFQYLRLNNVELKPSLWLYAIHSQNAELIHLLESSQVKLDNEILYNCLKESIKCHHNDISNYILNNLMYEKVVHNYIVMCGFQHHNYLFLPVDFENEFIFYFTCKYNYLTLVKLLLSTGEIQINKKISLV